MPIEIRELVIKVTVDDKSRRPEKGMDPRELARLKDKIVKECMDNLLRKVGSLSDR